MTVSNSIYGKHYLHKYISECTSTTVEPVGTATAYKIKAHTTPSVQKRTNSLTHGRGGGGTGTSSKSDSRKRRQRGQWGQGDLWQQGRQRQPRLPGDQGWRRQRNRRQLRLLSMAPRAHVSSVGINTYQHNCSTHTGRKQSMIILPQGAHSIVHCSA